MEREGGREKHWSKKCPIKGMYIILFKENFPHFKLTVVHCQIIIPIFILGNVYFWEGEFYSSSGDCHTIKYGHNKSRSGRSIYYRKKKSMEIFIFL